MGAEPFEVLATAAVRDARNGADFVAGLQARMPDVPIRVLSGLEEAEYSAMGVLCGIPTADGILADIGGGSLELVRLDRGAARRVADAAPRRDPAGRARRRRPVRARAIAEADLATVPWLAEGANRDLYLVGGAWRALARIHMAQTGYPLQMVHHYTIGREEARDLTGVIAGAGRRALERLPGLSRRRIDDLPFAAVVLRRVLRATGVRRVVFSASGLREGWFMQRMPEAIRARGSVARRRARAGGATRSRSRPCRRRCWPGPIRCSRTRPARRAGCARPRAGCRISAATTIRNSAPSRRSCGCCGSRASAWTITRARSSRWRSRMRYEVDTEAPFLRPGAPAAGRCEHAPRGGAGGGVAAGLHVVGRHARSAGRNRPAPVRRPAGPAARRRTAACSPARA